MPMRATPSAMLKRTTAGTKLLLSARNGLDGMNRPRRSTLSGGATSLVLKNDADCRSGRASEPASTSNNTTAHERARINPVRAVISLAADGLKDPRLAIREKVMYGKIVICSN